MSCLSAAKLVQSSATTTSVRDADDERRPVCEKGPDVDASIAQEPIHLLHTMLGQRTHGLGQAAPHCMDCQRKRSSARQGWHWPTTAPVGMQVAFIKGGDEVQGGRVSGAIARMRPAGLDVDACNHILIQSAPLCIIYNARDCSRRVSLYLFHIAKMRGIPELPGASSRLEAAPVVDREEEVETIGRLPLVA